MFVGHCGNHVPAAAPDQDQQGPTRVCRSGRSCQFGRVRLPDKAAGGANEAPLNIGERRAIRPSVRAYRCLMPAQMVARAIDQYAANAVASHVGERGGRAGIFVARHSAIVGRFPIWPKPLDIGGSHRKGDCINCYDIWRELSCSLRPESS